LKFRAGVLALATSAALPALLAAQTNPPKAPGSPTAKASPPTIVIERITVDELKKLVDTDQVLVLDVRAADAYREAHIPGALPAPLADLGKYVEMLKAAKKPIVTYCACTDEATAARASLKLHTAGIPGVRALLGGLKKWQADGNPVAHGDSPR